ncbi:hypothetical protein [Rubrivivax rivuli]|uniref:Uncharacterized protein n=1 Tax=Rubrivivax rivuli TaxID=1862385 RepID=A0A437RIB6_9BURK|nr:hypothetical protein [Rubrivivax rivuli]RVU46506.1 hypothetical protein EOE66_11850 [Rubrivivax rivuli]
MSAVSLYDFSSQPRPVRNRVLAQAGLGFVERRQCMHFQGQPGTGKSVVFAILAEPVNAMRKAERACRLLHRLRFLSRHLRLNLLHTGRSMTALPPSIARQSRTRPWIQVRPGPLRARPGSIARPRPQC